MSYPLYIFFGVVPSFIWLLFYLRKDVHPESNRTILRIFFWGMLAALPAIALELLFAELIESVNLSGVSLIIVNMFVGVALIEEFLKYAAVKIRSLRSPECDEPLDIMLYMIISALGFAAFENILILLPLGSAFLFKEAFITSGLRFVGATFLHALCSGLLGYFLALSFYKIKIRWFYWITGMGLATFLHGLYNFSIIEIEGAFKLFIPILILISLAIFVTFGFKRLKKLKSICLPDN